MMNELQNPLIHPPVLPHGVPAFDLIKDEHLLPAVRYGIEKARANLAALRDNGQAPTFENTIEALEVADSELARVACVFATICGSNSNDTVREIEEIADAEMSNYYSDLSLDEKLFERVHAVYLTKDALTLSPEQAKLLEETHKYFVRSGALLPAEAKKRLREINEELSKRSTLFSNNITKATEAYKKLITDEADLAGVPDRAKQLYRHLAKEEGREGFLITLSPPPIDIYTHAANRSLREEVYNANETRCFGDAFDNRENILALVKLRGERAKLMGYATYADYVLDDRMAGDTKTVQDFLEKNLTVYKKACEKELAAIRAFAKETDGIEELKPWDYAYYARLLKEKTFNFELETLRPYFNLEKVLHGLFQHAEKLFGIELRLETTGKYPVYNADVKTYEVFDKETGALIGLFYGDYYARPGAKHNGAWMHEIRGRSVIDGQINIPIVTNDCNFAKPTPEHPTFLSLDEVETVFHEFGHALHGLLTTARYRSLAGTCVKRDFVELPSQVQENWAFEKEVLDTFAIHHETKQPLPAEIIKKIEDMKNFDAGYAGQRQTFYGLLDMAFYACDPFTIENVEATEKKAAALADPLKRETGLRSTSFSHIFSGGYAVGYYSYKWAEVLDADVFAAFKAKGLYDPDLSKKLRTLYAAGGTAEPMELFVQLMGRRPDPEALYRRAGLIEGNIIKGRPFGGRPDACFRL